jgi:hypothetical protein
MTISVASDPNGLGSALSQQFNPTAGLAASMGPAASIPHSEHSAAASHGPIPHVKPLRKGGGRMSQMMLFDNPVEGGAPVKDFSGDDSTPPPVAVGG